MSSIFDDRLFPSTECPTIIAERYLLAAHVVAIASLLIPFGVARQSTCISCLLVILLQLRTHTTDTVDGDYMIFLQVSWLLIRWVDFAILHSPEKDLSHLGHNKTYETLPALTFHRKLWYSICLFTTFRGPSWSWRVKNIQPVPNATTRTSFCLTQLGLITKSFLVLSLHSYTMRFTALANLGPASQGYTSLTSLPLTTQIWHNWLCTIQAGCAICLGYHVPALVCVALHLSEPQDWPPCMSDWSEAYTVRNVWGKCYHQYLRRLFEQFNALLLNLFRIKRGTMTSRYMQLYGAFLFSALFHHIGALNLPYVYSVRYQFLFFMLQPVAIMVEDAVVALGSKMGFRSAEQSLGTRLLGYAWVFVSLTFTTRYMAMYYMDTGLSRVRIAWVDVVVDCIMKEG